MKKQQLLNPTNDYVFGRIFGYKGNEFITKGLLESITEQKYKSLEIASQIPTIRDLQNEKMGILDIKATADNNTVFDVEMQVANSDYMADRILWYWSNLYYNTINKGEKYKKTKKTIAILIADFDLKSLKNIPKFHTSWHIREDEFSEIILTEKLELHIIEIRKLEVNNNQKVKQEKLVKWLKFILNPNEMEEDSMEGYEDIKAAKKVLEEISQDEREQQIAYLRDKYIRDWNTMLEEGREEGREEGIEEGREEGIEEGLEKGREEGKKEVAKKMLKQNISLDIIIECTGLTKEEIDILKKEI